MSAYLVTTQEAEPRGETNFILRSAVPGATLTSAVRAAIAEIDPGLALEFRDFETQVNESLVQERTVALLSSFFGALALMLAMIGLYGVTSMPCCGGRARSGSGWRWAPRKGQWCGWCCAMSR